MTDEEIKQAQALCDAATSGPWRADGCGYGDFTSVRACAIRQTRMDPEPGYWGIVYDTSRDDCGHMMKKTDADFIAAARTLLPMALDEIERLRSIVQAVDHAREGMKLPLSQIVGSDRSELRRTQMLRAWDRLGEALLGRK